MSDEKFLEYGYPIIFFSYIAGMLDWFTSGWNNPSSILLIPLVAVIYVAFRLYRIHK